MTENYLSHFLYSVLIPNGYLLKERKIKKWSIVFLFFVSLSITGVLHLTQVNGNTWFGWCLISATLLIYIYGVFRSLIKIFKNKQFKNLFYKDQYFSVILNILFPGLGTIYLRRNIGILGIILTTIYYYYNLWWIFYFILLVMLVFLDLRYFLKNDFVNKKEIVIILLLLSFFGFFIRIVGYPVHNSIISIQGQSMSPTIEDNDIVIVDKNINKQLKRNAVIGFKDDFFKMTFIKRIIAIPGDTIYFSSSNSFFVNSDKQRYKWFIDTDSLVTFLNKKRGLFPKDSILVVPCNRYFVIGDNIEYSTDSRFFGIIDEKNIIAEMIKIIWPLSRIKKLQ
jgi:signal peptidase I